MPQDPYYDSMVARLIRLVVDPALVDINTLPRHHCRCFPVSSLIDFNTLHLGLLEMPMTQSHGLQHRCLELSSIGNPSRRERLIVTHVAKAQLPLSRSFTSQESRDRALGINSSWLSSIVIMLAASDSVYQCKDGLARFLARSKLFSTVPTQFSPIDASHLDSYVGICSLQSLKLVMRLKWCRAVARQGKGFKGGAHWQMERRTDFDASISLENAVAIIFCFPRARRSLASNSRLSSPHFPGDDHAHFSHYHLAPPAFINRTANVGIGV